MSHGMIVARSIASHEIPAAAARSHAFSITCTCPPEGTRGRRGAAVSRDARRVGAGRARRQRRVEAPALWGARVPVPPTRRRSRASPRPAPPRSQAGACSRPRAPPGHSSGSCARSRRRVLDAQVVAARGTGTTVPLAGGGGCGAAADLTSRTASQDLGLEEYAWVAVADAREQQALRGDSIARIDHLEAGRVGEVRLRRLRAGARRDHRAATERRWRCRAAPLEPCGARATCEW